MSFELNVPLQASFLWLQFGMKPHSIGRPRQQTDSGRARVPELCPKPNALNFKLEARSPNRL